MRRGSESDISEKNKRLLYSVGNRLLSQCSSASNGWQHEIANGRARQAGTSKPEKPCTAGLIPRYEENSLLI